MGWIDCALARVLLRGKHALPVILVLYDGGVLSMSELIQRVHGHAGSVIRTVRALEHMGILSRVRQDRGHHPVETRLTLKGINLVETPLYRWRLVIRKWGRI